MARQAGPIFLIGTFDGVHFYKMNGIYCVRAQSTLDAKTVKTSPRFRNTMKYAAMMGFSSKIASAVFKSLPAEFKESWMYRAFVGDAMRLFKQRKPFEEVYATLWKRYAAKYDEVEVFAHKEELRQVQKTRQRPTSQFNKSSRLSPAPGKRSARQPLFSKTALTHSSPTLVCRVVTRTVYPCPDKEKAQVLHSPKPAA